MKIREAKPGDIVEVIDRHYGLKVRSGRFYKICGDGKAQPMFYRDGEFAPSPCSPNKVSLYSELEVELVMAST